MIQTLLRGIVDIRPLSNCWIELLEKYDVKEEFANEVNAACFNYINHSSIDIIRFSDEMLSLAVMIDAEVSNVIKELINDYDNSEINEILADVADAVTDWLTNLSEILTKNGLLTKNYDPNSNVIDKYTDELYIERIISLDAAIFHVYRRDRNVPKEEVYEFLHHGS